MKEEVILEEKSDNWVVAFNNTLLNVKTYKGLTFNEAYKEIANILNVKEKEITGLMKR